MKIEVRDNGESKLQLRFRTEAGDALVLTDARIDMHGKVDRLDAAPVIELSTETGEIEIDDAEAGEATVTLSPEDLSAILDGAREATLLFDVLVGFPSLAPRNAKEFSLTIIRGVTRI
jgi:hypothetical protein